MCVDNVLEHNMSEGSNARQAQVGHRTSTGLKPVERACCMWAPAAPAQASPCAYM